ncbi:MAG: DegV family protein [Lachnospira sp.]|nr:DegV family protein [Lachnospira sp.]
MKRVGIVTDSHSGISQQEAQKLGIKVLPMPFYFDDVCYYEDLDLTREMFFEKLVSGAKVTTSQPTLESVKELWDSALEEFEQILYIPISSGLSGSCMTAGAMAADEPYEGRVFVVDNGRVSTPLHSTILDALELVEKGYSAQEIKDKLEAYREQMVIYVGVDTLEFLKRGGRVKPTVAAIGNILNIKPVLKFDVGTLDMHQKCRGRVKMRKAMIEAMRQELDTRFKTAYEQGKLHIVAASSSSKEDTESWLEEIREAFPGMDILCDDLSLGLCCHIGPNGLGIGCLTKVE